MVFHGREVEFATSGGRVDRVGRSSDLSSVAPGGAVGPPGVVLRAVLDVNRCSAGGPTSTRLGRALDGLIAAFPLRGMRVHPHRRAGTARCRPRAIRDRHGLGPPPEG